MRARPTRFVTPCSSLSLPELLTRMRNSLWPCLALGIAAHLSLTQVRWLESQQKAAKPLTTQFVKRQPRLTKPLELKKRPQPKRRRVERKMVAVKARAKRGQKAVAFQVPKALQGLVRPKVAVVRGSPLVSDVAEPTATGQTVASSREAREVVDLSLEMLDVGALDTGQYQAMVIQDPTDKRNVRGFFHFVRGYSRTMRHTGRPEDNQCEERQVCALKRLARYVSQCTDIKADVTGFNVPLDSDDILQVPWMYLGTHWPFQLTSAELRHLGRYLLDGGFLFAEALRGFLPPRTDGSFRGMFREALAYEGIRDRAFERLPNTHAIYHCYFDFDGPPMGYPFRSFHGTKDCSYLEGLVLEEGRLVGILSLKWYANPWGDWGPEGFGTSNFYKVFDPTRALQFGVNLIVFALTQEGGLTHRLMQSVQ